ncbi:MAG: hypothetical protein Unbinned338contig1000_45 [Prokaryotic dsDNA virus sp.]|nr:MAG: hypothetical protein Unbinned338contig1000_45 [Prokaryotic dsDNA virus sp.]
MTKYYPKEQAGIVTCDGVLKPDAIECDVDLGYVVSQLQAPDGQSAENYTQLSWGIVRFDPA